MWEKKEPEKDQRTPVMAASSKSEPAYVPAPAPSVAASPAAAAARGRAANIGTSLFIKGEVSGSEDLTVEGRVEGRIDLKDHNLTVAHSGRVSAEVHAKNVTIVGEATGNILADEKVEIADTGRLVGDIHAPRVSISDGAQFRGSVEMTREKGAVAAPVASVRERPVTTAAPPQIQLPGRVAVQS